MNEHSEGLNYSEMKAELQALRKKLEDLETKQAAFKSSTHPTVRRRFPKRLIIASIPLAVLVVAGGLLWGQGAVKALFVDAKGNVGIGTDDPKAALDVKGTASVGNLVSRGAIDAGNSELVFTEAKHSYSARGNTLGFAAIENDGPILGALAILGRTTSTTPLTRVVSVYDRLGIGKGPEVPLDVNGNARVGGDLNLTGKLVSTGAIEAASSDLYFTKTDHDHSAIGNAAGYAAIENSKNYNGLMILGRMNDSKTRRVVRMWDYIGIGGGPDKIPQAQLDVVGEIRGKPWVSAEYEWSCPSRCSDQPGTKMTKTDHSVCFLTYVSGMFYGGGEVVEIVDSGGYWVLKGAEGQYYPIKAKARCIGAPDNSW
jgi:hypothetical protein